MGALVTVIVFALRQQAFLEAALGGWIAVPGLALLIGGAIAANRIMSCPACGQRLPSFMHDRICSRCAAVLTDEPGEASAPARRADSRALAYMDESRSILERWAVLRVKLRKTIWWIGGATAAGLLVWFRQGGKAWSESIAVGLIVGLIAAGLSWLLLNQVVDNFFGIGFMLLRGRCPVCKAWFKQSMTVGIGEISTDYSLPNFCVNCRVDLTKK